MQKVAIIARWGRKADEEAATLAGTTRKVVKGDLNQIQTKQIPGH